MNLQATEQSHNTPPLHEQQILAWEDLPWHGRRMEESSIHVLEIDFLKPG